MGFDDLDDLLNGDDELEAAFRELDAKIKLDEIRAKGGSSKRRASTSSAGAKPSESAGARGAKDPLADLKAAFDGKPAARAKRPKAKPASPRGDKRSSRSSAHTRYLVVVCPSCSGKNRVPLERLRTSLPICGRCKTDLSFERG